MEIYDFNAMVHLCESYLKDKGYNVKIVFNNRQRFKAHYTLLAELHSVAMHHYNKKNK